jgi:hypothetical protein
MFNAVLIIGTANLKLLCLGVMNAVFIISSANPQTIVFGYKEI